MEELRVTFSLRILGMAGHYYEYRFTTPMMVGLANPKNLAKRWFFMGVNGKKLKIDLPGPIESPSVFMSFTSPWFDFLSFEHPL